MPLRYNVLTLSLRCNSKKKGNYIHVDTYYLLALWAEILINLFATLEPRFYEVLRNILPPLLRILVAES